MLSVKSLTVTGLQWYCAFMHPGFINGVPSGYTGVAGVGVADGSVLGSDDGSVGVVLGFVGALESVASVPPCDLVRITK